jgi:hypothetical protein
MSGLLLPGPLRLLSGIEEVLEPAQRVMVTAEQVGPLLLLGRPFTGCA